MAKKKPVVDPSLLQPDEGNSIPRIALSPNGFSGLRVINNTIIEETNRSFRYPNFLRTVDEMRNDATIASALNVYNMMLGRVEWRIKPPENATSAQLTRAKFVAECMEDMDNPWSNFISEVCTYLTYGFQISEKVFRRRLKKNGSKYNDGFVGIKTLAPRGQDTIRKWVFSDDGRELLGIEQSLINLETGYRYINLAQSPNGLIPIPRNKFLLFSADSTKGNPEGKSILKAVYLPYKQMTLLRDQLMLGVSKDLQGIPKIGVPPQYLDPNASADKVAVYTAFKAMVDGLAAGTQRGIIYPLQYDQDSKLPLFDIELMEAKGGKSFDIPSIIAALQNDILVALSVDVIKMGSSEAGSFSLADAKTNLLSLQLEHRLKEIRDVLNSDLMLQLHQLNGWDTDNMPTFEYGDLAEVDADAFSKVVQRAASVGLVEVDRPVLNKIRKVMGVEPKDEDAPVNKSQLTGATSGASEGMASPTGQGTSTNPFNKQDSSANNADNAP